MAGLIKHSETINKLLARNGVKFGIYKNGEFREQLFPFDPTPRVIRAEEFAYLEQGLKQRVDALNCFLRDIYGKKQILRDGVIPEEFVFSAKGFLPPCDGVMPPRGFTATFPASTWCNPKTTAGTFWKTTCGCPPARPIP